MQSDDLVALVAELARAKQEEGDAQARRIAAEEAIIRATGFALAEGQKTYDRTSAAGTCKVVLKQPVNTTVDSEAWPKLRRTLPADHPGRAVFRAKYEIITRDARELQQRDPSAWADVAAVVTRKPGKVGVEIHRFVATAREAS